MKWCCVGFKSAYDAAGQRGSAILIGRDSLNAPEFTLQYRAIDAGKENYIQSDIPTSIIIDVRILFCLWCGANLEKFYAGQIDALFRNGLRIDALKQN